MMIDIIRHQHLARELLQVVVFLVGGMVRTDDAEPATALFHVLKILGNNFQGLRP